MFIHKAIDDLVIEYIKDNKITIDQALHLYYSYRQDINEKNDKMCR